MRERSLQVLYLVILLFPYDDGIRFLSLGVGFVDCSDDGLRLGLAKGLLVG